MLLQALAAAAGVLAASSGHVLAAKPYESVSRCSVSSISAASAESAKAAQYVATEVSAALCHPGPAQHERYRTAAYATATAFTTAIVDVTAACYASGTATFEINGHSLAYAEAVAIAEAYAGALTSADACDRCSAAGTAVAASFQEIFLQATSDLEYAFSGFADGADVDAAYEVVATSMKAATVEVFAEAIASARAGDGKCSGQAVANTAAGVEGGPQNSASCAIDLDASAVYIVSDAVVVASAEAGAKACVEEAGLVAASVSVEAVAVAKAMAVAMTEISASCYIEGQGYGCAAGEVEITRTAQAVAGAFVEGFAVATSDCYTGGCTVNAHALSQAIASVLAIATSQAIAHQCTGPDSHFDYEETVLVVVDGSAVAIAEAIVTATVDASSRCHASVDTGSGASPPTAPVHPPGGHVDTHAPHPVHAHADTPSAPAPTRPTPTPRSGRKRSSHPKRRHAKRGHKVSKKGGRRVAKKGGHKGARKVARKPVRKPVRKGGRKKVPKGGRRGGQRVQQKRPRKGGAGRKGAKSAKRRAPRRRPRRAHAA